MSIRSRLGHFIRWCIIRFYSSLLAVARRGGEFWTWLWELALLAPGRTGIELRRQFYSKNLKRCGEGVVFFPGVVIHYPENVELDSDVHMGRGVFSAGREA